MTHKQLSTPTRFMPQWWASAGGLYAIGSLMILVISALIYINLFSKTAEQPHMLDMEVLDRDGVVINALPEVLSVQMFTEFDTAQLMSVHDLVMVDVRSTQEWAIGGHIQGSINIPIDELSNRAQWELNPTDSILIICGDEPCTMNAASVLAETGFPQTYRLYGSTLQWMMAGFTICTDC